MGWDISYHPISEQQMQEWYFDVLDNPERIEQVIRRSGMEEFYAAKYRQTMDVARSTGPEDTFDKTHGFYIAVVQGFFGDYFYTRGSALSFIEHPVFRNYCRPWTDFVPERYLTQTVHNRLVENYCGGVYLPYESAARLLTDYADGGPVREELDRMFSHGRIKVLLKALRFACAQRTGLLEAAEVVTPDPFDLNNSSSYSNLFHCDIDGPLLYHEAAKAQLEQLDRLPANELQPDRKTNY